MQINCLASGIQLTDEVAEILFQTALDVVKRKGYRRKISDDSVSGMMTTEYKSANIAGTSGIVFEAMVETEISEGKVTFFVHESAFRSETDDEPFAWLPV